MIGRDHLRLGESNRVAVRRFPASLDAAWTISKQASGVSFGPQGHTTGPRSKARGAVAAIAPGCHAAYFAAPAGEFGLPNSSARYGPKSQPRSMRPPKTTLAHSVGT